MVLCFSKVQAASDFDLEKLDFDAKLNIDGSMDVVETWQIDVNGTTNTLFKTFKIDNKYSNITNVSVSELTNGGEIAFEQNSIWKNHVDTKHFHALEYKGAFEIAWGINISRGKHTYIVRYKVNDVVTVYNDCAELYWQFIGQDFEVPASKVTGKITIPNNVELQDNLRVWGHGGLNGEVARQSNNEVSFSVIPYITGNFLEIRVAVLEPEMFELASKKVNSDMLENIVEEETGWAIKANEEREEYKKRKRNIQYGITGGSAVVGIVFIALIVKAIKKIRQTHSIEPTETPEYFRDIPNKNETPAEVAFLYYYRNISRDKAMPRTLSATLLDLSLKKHIAFEVDDTLPKKEQVIIKLINDPNAEYLKESEKLVLDLFRKIPADSSIPQFNMKEFEKYAKKHNSSFIKSIEKIQKQAEKEQTEAGHYNKGMEEHRNNWNVAGTFIIIILAFVSLFMMGMFSINIWSLLFIIIPGIVYSVLCFAIGGKFNGLTQTRPR